MDSVKCLNGDISVGDVVAIAVSDARYGSGMRIGVVMELLPVVRYGKNSADVKARVTHTSGGFGGVPYTKTFPYPERMVKIVQ